MAYSKNTDAGLIVPKKWYESLPRPSWSRFEKVETGQPWFSVYETIPDTYALYEDGQFEEVISYLVIGEDTHPQTRRRLSPHSGNLPPRPTGGR